MKTPVTMFVLGSVAVCGAATEVQQTFGGPGVDRGIFACPTPDGGYVAVGVTNSEDAGQEDVYLVKTDATGEKEWTRTYGGAGHPDRRPFRSTVTCGRPS